ncbi:hypothetical protein, partial [Proteus mirabilis]|uniref:hypothetical protein n=1 Tax=Proteus mirabilis TaxID=584 RepID=UPI001954868D
SGGSSIALAMGSVQDKKAVEELTRIAGVADVMALGMDMFKVKSAVEGASMKDLVFRDYKLE